MSAPWWHPEANPLADIRAFMRAAEQEYRDALLASPLVVVAPRYEHALLWSRREGLLLRAWRWAGTPDHLYGLHHGTVIVLSEHDLARRGEWEDLLRVLAATGVTVRRDVT